MTAGFSLGIYHLGPFFMNQQSFLQMMAQKSLLVPGLNCPTAAIPKSAWTCKKHNQNVAIGNRNRGKTIALCAEPHLPAC